MKKALSLVLALILTVSTVSLAFASGDADMPEIATLASIEDYVDWSVPQELTVGSVTQLSGYFFTDMWGNNTSDVDARALIHGYGTVAWSYDGNYSIDNTVVESVTATADAEGNRTYLFTLHNDLTYNDGSAITAEDYVFAALLISSPEMAELGGVPTGMQHVVGYDSFLEGNPFSGIRLLSDDSFSLTIAAEYLPNYFELSLVNVAPYPMSVIAPQCGVLDDGEGAYINGSFTTELLKETVLNEDTGYLYQPRKTCGPYSLTMYDSEAHVATFEKNVHYKGNFEGQVPIIERLTFQYVDSATAIDEVLNGSLDVVNKISDAKAIEEGFAHISQDSLSAAVYLRSGFSFLSFACEMGPTQSAAVRKAVAFCIDVPSLIDQFLGANGAPVYGYYGLGQWMAADNQEALDELAIYEYDPEAAVRLLVKDGWTRNAQGEKYESGVRYRKNDAGELEALELSWAKAEGTGLSDLLEAMLVENFAKVGIGLTIQVMPFSDVLKHYYRQEERTYNMFNLATNFTMVFDPYYTFDTDDMYQGVFNTTGIKDEELMQLAKDMRKTKIGDDVGYLQKWFAFQERWVEVLPMVPLYSNVYFDFSRPDLQNYYPNSHFSWAASVLYSYIGAPPDLTEETAEDEFEF